MPSSQPAKTTQVTEVKLPKWVDKAAQVNYKEAQQVADQPYKSYQGDRVAGMSPYQQAGWKEYQQDHGADNSYKGASSILTGVGKAKAPGAITADMVKAGKFTDVNMDAYMNPYIDNVVDKSMGALEDQRVKSVMANADAASKARAFGGSRSGIVDAVTNAETAKSAGLLSAQLRADAFNTAAGLATDDLNRDYDASKTNASNSLTADQFNVNTILNSRNQKIQAGQALAGVGDSQTKKAMQDFVVDQQFGGQDRAIKQGILDAKYEDWQGKQGEALNDLNLKLTALGMSPYGKTETANKESTGGSSGTDFASLGLGVMSLLPLFFASDERLKEDVQKLGKDPETGLDMYAYRYKGDPKTYPKVVGPMAQDVAKMDRKKVKKVGKFMAVKFDG